MEVIEATERELSLSAASAFIDPSRSFRGREHDEIKAASTDDSYLVSAEHDGARASNNISNSASCRIADRGRLADVSVCISAT